MVRVTVMAPLRPTEVPERVVAACTAFWPNAAVQVLDDHVEAEAASMETFREHVWRLRIIDTVRARLLAGADGPRLRFALAKQAAFAGRPSFPVGPHGLGELEVTVEVGPGDAWPDAEALAWWLCPQTRDGEIVQD